ncbi:MAG: hypothetical protein F9B45_24830 [Phycisphaera sp. RhM]|nr:hypothetical protein [Phycisphaera sp. RhM]
MSFRHIAALVFFLSVTSQTFGFEVSATIRKIDTDKSVAVVFANGQQRTVAIAGDVKTLGENGEALPDGLRADAFKEGAEVTLSVERIGNVPTIVAIRLGSLANSISRPNGRSAISVGKSSVGFKPLTEMTADDRYKGEDGGLYGGGRNEPPEPLRADAMKATANIQPLDADGHPAKDGKIGLVSISMSNATQEFSRFKQLADADPEKSARVTIVDCAQGGQTMARWADPQAPCWTEADRRLEAHGVSRQQVQVAWIKLANAGPTGELHEHGKQLERDTRKVLANLVTHFPNLRIAYLGSRIYGGWADGRLNPEPYAYEGAFVVRWLIQSQMQSDPDLNFDPQEGEVKSPLLLWGPYFWADGTTPRKSDGLVWQRSDLVGDGTHPSDTGRQKVAEQLLRFFKNDPYTQQWFVRH